MIDQDSDLKELRAQFERLEREFQDRFETLRLSIDRVEANRASISELNVMEVGQSLNEVTGSVLPPSSDILRGPQLEPIERKTVDSNIFFEAVDVQQGLASPEPLRTENVDIPGSQILEEEGKNAHLVLAVLGPVGEVMEKIYAAYQHYRAQGKAPAFLLTVAGLFALTAGFGYLLQYSFSNLLGPIAKLVLGVLSGGVIVFGGALLHRRRPNMADFASSVIGLGIIVLDLCAYFAGPYFGLVSPLVNFTFFAVVVTLGYALALAFEARVVAVVTLGGGVIGPWLVTQSDTIADVYAVLLLFLSAASFHLARRLSWHTLAQLTFISTVAALEAMTLVFTAIDGLLPAVAIVHFYLVFYFLLFDGRRLRSRLLQSTAVMLIAESAFLIAICVQTIENSDLQGSVLMVNAVIIGIPFFMGFSATSLARPLFLLCAGGLLGFGLLSVVVQDYLGMLLGAEAVALVYAGVRYASPSVRYEGCVLLALAGIEVLLGMSRWLINGDWLFSMAWLAVVAMVGLLEITGHLLIIGGFDKTGIRSTGYWVREAEALFAALVWLGLVCIFVPGWISVLAVVPLFGLLYFASLYGLQFAQWLALGHIGFLVGGMAFAASEVGNFHFSDQPLFAQFSRVAFFGVLWLLQACYERFNIQSIFTPWSHFLRQLFYVLLPLQFLPAVFRDFYSFFPIALWVSATITWVLVRFVGSTPLRIEAIVLSWIASMVTLIAWGTDYLGFSDFHSYGALGLGILCFGGLVFVEGGVSPLTNHPLRALLLLTSYYVGAVLTVMVFEVSGSFLLAMTFLTIYFAWLAAEPLPYGFVRPLTKGSYLLATLIATCVVGLTCVGFHGSLEFMVAVLGAIAAWGYLLHRNLPGARLGRSTWGGALKQQLLWHGLIVLAYMSLNANMWGDSLGPGASICLVLHATALLFVTLIPRWKPMLPWVLGLFIVAGGKIIFFDMVQFAIVAKIVALMVIGMVLLGAAYWYQHVTERNRELNV